MLQAKQEADQQKQDAKAEAAEQRRLAKDEKKKEKASKKEAKAKAEEAKSIQRELVKQVKKGSRLYLDEGDGQGLYDVEVNRLIGKKTSKENIEALKAEVLYDRMTNAQKNYHDANKVEEGDGDGDDGGGDGEFPSGIIDLFIEIESWKLQGEEGGGGGGEQQEL